MERKGLAKKCLESVIIGATALATTFGPMAQKADAHASLIEEYWNTNGVQVTNNTLTNGTPYVLKLKLDFSPSDVATNKIRGGTWQISVNTPYVNFTTSSIPLKVDDFWGNYTMDPSYNYVDFTFDGTVLSDNSRIVSANDGPAGVSKVIEDLYFTPSATTVASTQLFFLGGLHFYDTSSHDFKVTGATGIYKLGTVQPLMNIVDNIPEPNTGLLLGLGTAALALRRRQRRKFLENPAHARNTGRKI